MSLNSDPDRSSAKEVRLYHFSNTTEDDGPFKTTDEYDAEIRNDMRSYRVRYFFSQSCKGFYTNSRRRLPSGKAVYLTLVVCFLERLAYYAAIGNIFPPFLEVTHLSLTKQQLLQSIMEILAQLLYPLMGWVADVWVGRYRAIQLSLWLLWIGYGTVAFSFSFDHIGHMHVESWNRYLLPLCFVLISLGSAGFQTNMIPFGADQIAYKASEELSSYFYWYYFVRNVGAIVYFVSFTCSNFTTQVHAVSFGLLATLSITIALCLNHLLRHWLFIDTETKNPLKMVAKVLYEAAKAKRPRDRSAFSYTGRDAPSRMDLAKTRHGGSFSDENVEDVKTFVRLLFVLISLAGVLCVYAGITNVIGIQFDHMKSGTSIFNFKLFGVDQCESSDTSAWIVNILVIIASIPILNQIVFPLLREFTPNMLKRIGIGYIAAVVAPFTLAIVNGVGHHMLAQQQNHHTFPSLPTDNTSAFCMFTDSDIVLPISSWVIVLPHFTITVTEIFVNISSLEFFYAQSPHNMRGLMIGLFFFVWGMSASVATLILFNFDWYKVSKPVSCGFWYYTVFFVISVVFLFVFVGVARWYKNRQRGELETQRDIYYRIY